MYEPRNLWLLENKPDQVHILVDQSGSVTLDSRIERDTCPGCDSPVCAYSCDASQSDDLIEPESAEDMGARLLFNGAVDGIEAALTSVVAAMNRRGLFDQIPELPEILEEALVYSLDGVSNHA